MTEMTGHDAEIGGHVGPKYPAPEKQADFFLFICTVKYRTFKRKERSAMATDTIRTERVEARIAPDVLAMVRRAAEIEGRSLSDFLVGAAQEAARRTIEQTQLIRLSMEEQQRFAALLLDPPALSPAMARAAKAHKKLISSSR
jgi:uncharacterized protein (DUF1778 family)